MTLPTARGLARLVAPLALTALGAFPALAQDCWLPDAFEPNDVVPVTIVPGVYDGLRLSGADLNHDSDVDRFRVLVPAWQRLALDFDVRPPVNAPVVMNNRLLGTLAPEDGSVPPRFFDTAPSGIARPAVYDNATNQAVVVVFDVMRDWHQPVGCTEYSMNATIVPRPCDVLTDDHLEGPDDCASAAVLPDGLHSGLIVFNDRRLAGRDVDVYRIANVAPGDWFEIEILDGADDGLHSDLELFAGDDCGGPTFGSVHRKYVTNGTLSATNYTVRVSSDHDAGFEEYALSLVSGRCAALAPDVHEPNGACGPFAPLVAGTHTLNLTYGDNDGYLVRIPPSHTLTARAVVQSQGQRVDVGGAAAPSCPPVGRFPAHFVANNGPAPLDYHLRVESRDGSCAEYTFVVEIEPVICSPAHAAENEPNDDCASATPIPLVDGRAALSFALTPGDVDFFLVRAPAGQDLEISPGLGLGSPIGYRLTATANDDCSGRSWSIQHPGTEFALPPYDARLSSRSDRPQDYVLRVEPLAPLTECMVVDLSIRTVTPADSGPNATCGTAIPAEEWTTVWGDLGPDRPLMTATTVQPGETLTAAFFEIAARVNVPVELRFHDGTADCESRSASLGMSRYVPPTTVDEWGPDFMALRHRFTNAGSTPRHVIVELAVAPAHFQWLHNVSISLNRTPGAPFTTFCLGNDVTFTTVVCPCDNFSASSYAEGCLNSTGRGARLSATGSPSVAADDLVLHAEGLPLGAPIIVVGVATSGSMTNAAVRTFMDGRLCLGLGAQPLLSGRSDAAGSWSAPTPLAGRLGMPAFGDRIYLQAWYRDAHGPCGAGSNLTNGVRVDWE